MKWGIGALLFVVCFQFGGAAESDLTLEVLTRTGDASVGPIGKAMTDLELYSLGVRRSIGMGEDGRVYFTAEFEREMETMSGFYSVKNPGQVAVVSETGFGVPGVVVSGGGVLSSEDPWGVISVSQSGGIQVVGKRSDYSNFDQDRFLDQAFLYRANQGFVELSPLDDEQ